MPGASPGYHHAAAGRPPAAARQPGAVSFPSITSSRSPVAGPHPARPHPGRRRRCRPPTRDRRTPPASAGCACGRRRRPAPRPGASVLRDDSASWVAEGVLPGAAGDPCAGPSSRPPAGVVVGNRPLAGRALPGPAPCAATGDLFAESVRNVWPAGCWGSSPGRLYLFSPLPAPLPWSVSFPRRFREARWDRRPRAGVLLCRPARRRAAAPGTAPQGPDGPKRFNRHHHIDGRCHLDLFKMLGTLDPDVHRPGARPRGVRRWARTAGGRRATRPGPGVDPHATGGGHQVPPRRSAPAATGSAFTLVERPAQLLAAPRPSGPVS